LALLNSDAFLIQTGWKAASSGRALPGILFFCLRNCKPMRQPFGWCGRRLSYQRFGMAALCGFPAAQYGLETEEVFSPCAAAALYSRQAFLQVLVSMRISLVTMKM